MKKIVMISAGILICGGIVFANQVGVKSLNFGAPSVKDVNQVADPRDGDIVYQDPDTGPAVPGFWGRINGAWIELLSSGTVTPAGVISAYGGVTAPAGYLPCDGTSYSAATYPALAQALWDSVNNKYAYGGTGTFPNGSFNVPDFRGRFMRGVDSSGLSRDPGTRVASNSGGNTGNNVGSYEDDAFQDHVHQSNLFHNVFGQAGPGNTLGNANGVTGGQNSVTGAASTLGYRTSNETRPENVSVNFIIKY